MLKYTLIITLLVSFLGINALGAQILLEENFDSTAIGSIPFGWNHSINAFSHVTPTQACAGNAYRMNIYSGNTSAFLDSPEIPRDSTNGNISISFDMRVADYNDNSQLQGTGKVGAQLFVNNTFFSDLLYDDPILYLDCETQTFSIPTADIPLGATFKIRFFGIWGTGDWVYIIDNFSARVVNDECEDAVLLPQTVFSEGIVSGDVVDGSLEGATSSQAACTGVANDDVWYKFVATQRSVSLTVGAGDVVIELFSGSCGSLSSLFCSNGSPINEIFTYHGTEIGETYYVRVYSFADTLLRGPDAEFIIQIGTPKSVNNECASAIALSQSAATSCDTNLIMGTVEDATQSQTSCTGTANDDVWYQFKATSTDFSVFLESGDLVLELFEGTCGNLNQLLCEDGIGINETFNYASANIDSTYYLRVHSFGSTPLTGGAAEFGICVFTSPPLPVNDDCSSPIDLTVTLADTCTSAVSGTTNGGTRTESNLRCGGINGSSTVWYRFTASSSEHIITLSNVNILNGNDGDISSFEVFSGSCAALTSLFCSGQLFGSNPGPVIINGLTANEEYLLRVVPVNPHNSIDFDICITTSCPDLPLALAWNDVTSTSVELSIWVTDTTERSFVLVASGDDPLDTMTNFLYSNYTEDTEVVATGLLPNTAYDFYILSCGEATDPLPLTTCPALPTTMLVFGVSNTTAQLLIYRTGGGERTFVVVANGDDVMDASNHVFTESTMDTIVQVSGLTPGTDYDFYIQSCDNADLSGPIAFTTLCELATGLTVTDITPSGATLNIGTEALQERDYLVMPFGVTPVFGGAGSIYGGSSSLGSLMANNLSPSTTYDFYVGQGCNENFAGPITFTTPCELADSLAVDNITTTSAELSIGVGGTQFRDYVVMPFGVPPVFGGNDFVYFTTTSNGVATANNLSPNTTYDFYVGQGCNEAFAGPITFTTDTIPVNVQMTIENSSFGFNQYTRGVVMKSAQGDQYQLVIDPFAGVFVYLDNSIVPTAYLPTGDLYIDNSNHNLLFRSLNSEYVKLVIDGNGDVGEAFTADPSGDFLRLNTGSFGLLENGAGIILKDSDQGNCWKLYISNAGELLTTMVNCPD